MQKTRMAPSSLMERGRNRIHVSVREFLKFSVIGTLNTLFDFAVFNVLIIVYPHSAVPAKILASLVSTVTAYAMNRAWVFRRRKRGKVRWETLVYFLLNGVGLVIQAGAVAVATYGFDVTDKLSLNVVSLLSLGAGTAFRFWSYRRFVWRAEPEPAQMPSPSVGTSRTLVRRS